MSFLGALGSWLVGDGPNGRDGRDDHSQGLEETRLAEAHPGTASLLGRALGATVGVVATSVRRSIAANVGDGLLSAEVARIEADARSGQAASKIDGWLTRVNHEDGHMRFSCRMGTLGFVLLSRKYSTVDFMNIRRLFGY